NALCAAAAPKNNTDNNLIQSIIFTSFPCRYDPAATLDAPLKFGGERTQPTMRSRIEYVMRQEGNAGIRNVNGPSCRPGYSSCRSPAGSEHQRAASYSQPGAAGSNTIGVP